MTATHSHPTQSSQILRHLEVNGSITPREAIDRFQCYRLAARVHELRQRGHVIDCDLSGGFARYSLATPVQLALL